MVLAGLAAIGAACGSARRSHRPAENPAKVVVRDIDFELENRYQSRDNVHKVVSRDEQQLALWATRIVLSRGWNLGCLPYRDAVEAHRVYGEEEIAIVLPKRLSIPTPGALRLRRANERKLEGDAQRDCVARPMWIVEPIELFYTQPGRAGRLFGVYCEWGYTSAGAPQREYPAHSRRFYVRERDDGIIEIERAPLEYPHFPPFPEHVARRKQKCERGKSSTQ